MASYSQLSKAQSSFFNILHTPSSQIPINLNLRLFSTGHTGGSESHSSANTQQQQQEIRGVETVPFAVKTHTGDNDCLDLLIEAAKLVSAEDESNSEGASQRTGVLDESIVKKRKRRWVVVDLCSEMDDTSSPVVRSNRGRTQALPYRFRDSLMEPLKRSGRSSKRLIGS